MAKDDLKLLFETERQILARRLGRLFPSGLSATTTRPSESRGARPSRKPDESPMPRRRRTATVRLRGVTTWGLSLILHAALLAMLLPTTTPEEPKRSPTPVEIRWIPRPVAKTPDPPAAPPADPVVEAPPPEPLPTVDDPPPVPEAPRTLEPATPEPAEEDPSEIGLAGATPSTGESTERAPSGPFESRGKGRVAAIRRYGGTEATERAVEAGLRWLIGHQDADGSWSPDGFQLHCEGRTCRGSGFPEYRVGITGLATLALLASVDGLSSDPPSATAIRKAVDFLVSSQDDRGCYGPRKGNYMYNHAIATFCIAEAAALTRDERLRRSAERGLAFSAEAQQPGGGWDYTSARTLRNDLSITGWQVMAIQAARGAGAFFPDEMEQRVRRFVRRAAPASGWATYADRGIGEGRGGVSIAAVAMLSKLYLGWSPGSPEMARTAEILVRSPPNDGDRVDWERTFQSSYYWYYATLALFHVGGDAWEAWNVWIQRTILPLQRTTEHREGSWDPDPNWLGAAGGRVATTALNVLTLEVYYRYAPLAKRYGLEGNR